MLPTPDLRTPDQSEDIGSLIMRTSKLLKELRSLTAKDMGLVRRRSLQTVAELADLRDTLVNMARERLSSRQVLMLSTGSGLEESLLVDPSIRFFGVEWDGLSQRWLRTVTCIQQLLVTMDSMTIDILQFNSVLSEISRVEGEVSLHTEAVLSGRLNEEDQNRQYQQQQFLTVPRARSGSSREIKRKTSMDSSGRNSTSPMHRSRSLREKLGFSDKEKGVKYIKSKTTDLTPTLDRRNLTPGLLTRPRSQGDNLNLDSFARDGERRRKSSFIDQISNMLKSIL